MFSAKRGFASAMFNRCFICSTVSTSCRALPLAYSRVLKARSQKTPPNRLFTSLPHWKQQAAPAPLSYAEADEEEIKDQADSPEPPSGLERGIKAHHGPITKFEELSQRGLVSKPVVDRIVRDMGLTTMTQVQSLTIEELLGGRDVCV